MPSPPGVGCHMDVGCRKESTAMGRSIIIARWRAATGMDVVMLRGVPPVSGEEGWKRKKMRANTSFPRPSLSEDQQK